MAVVLRAYLSMEGSFFLGSVCQLVDPFYAFEWLDGMEYYFGGG